MDRTPNASFTIRTTLDAAVVDATNSIAVIGNHGTNQCPARKFKIFQHSQTKHLLFLSWSEFIPCNPKVTILLRRRTCKNSVNRDSRYLTRAEVAPFHVHSFIGL